MMLMRLLLIILTAGRSVLYDHPLIIIITFLVLVALGAITDSRNTNGSALRSKLAVAAFVCAAVSVIILLIVYMKHALSMLD